MTRATMEAERSGQELPASSAPRFIHTLREGRGSHETLSCRRNAAQFCRIAREHAQSIDEIKKKGEIVVGVKVNSPPWGTLDPTGKPAGFEVDLANEIAAKLGVKPNITVVTSSNRIEYLRQGRIDMILATMSSTEERRKVVAMINPHYFANSTNILLAHDAGVRDWAELKGKTLCGVQGSLQPPRFGDLRRGD